MSRLKVNFIIKTNHNYVFSNVFLAGSNGSTTSICQTEAQQDGPSSSKGYELLNLQDQTSMEGQADELDGSSDEHVENYRSSSDMILTQSQN